MNEERSVVVVTADVVEDTGIISFKFMIDADLHSKMCPVPQMFGRVWKPDKDTYLINVFKGGQGINLSAPLSQEGVDGVSEDFYLDAWDSIPSCSLLMNTTDFEWFKQAAADYGLEFIHIHHDGALKTS